MQIPAPVDAVHPKAPVPVTLEDQEKVPAAQGAGPKEVPGAADLMVEMAEAEMEASEVARLQPAHSAERLPEKLGQWSKALAISIFAQTARIFARTYSVKNNDALQVPGLSLLPFLLPGRSKSFLINT